MTEISLQDVLNNHKTVEELNLSAKLSGRYQRKGVLGEGATAIVYRAFDQYLGCDVALKILRPECGKNPAMRERFLREAKALGSLSHPNILKVLAWGTDEKQNPLIAMDLLEGCSLASLLLEQTVLSLGQFKAIFSQVLSGLEYAHEHGIIHRDIKPENIIVDCSRDQVKATLIDFSIARLEQSEQSSASLTKTGIMIGTPAYMSPEQCMGQKATLASDVYSIACVMYESLCGRLPFSAESSMELLQKHISEEPEKIVNYAINEPSRRLGLVIDAALIKDRLNRTGSASLLQSQLEQAWQGVSVEETVCFNRKGKPKESQRNYIILGAVLISLLGCTALYCRYTNAENFVAISETRTNQESKAFLLALRQKQRALLRLQSWKDATSIEARYERAQEYFYCLRDLALVYCDHHHYQEGKTAILNTDDFVRNLNPQIKRSKHALCLKDLANLYLASRDFDNAAKTLAELKKQGPLNVFENSEIECCEARFLICARNFSEAASHLQNAINFSDEFSRQHARQDGYDVEARKLAESSPRASTLVYDAMLECTSNLPRNLQSEQSSYLKLAKVVLEFHQTHKNAVIDRKLFIRYMNSVQIELVKLEAASAEKSLCEAIHLLISDVDHSA